MGPIDRLSDDEKSSWHTYLCRARKLTRCSVGSISHSESPIELKPPKTDDTLLCCQKCGPATFYKSINSMIFSIFTAEFRINLVARDRGIYTKKLTEYINKDGKLIHRKIRFQDLGLYEKWINFPSVFGRKPAKKYHASIGKLKSWIEKRNRIAHAKYWKFTQSTITPQDAFECYESVVDSIFELNILVYKRRKTNEKSKREVSLMP